VVLSITISGGTSYWTDSSCKARCGPTYVKARVVVRQYPDDTLAVFGPRLLARYDAQGQPFEMEASNLKAAA